MSLLMQALRKAESAKKKQGGGPDTPDTPDALVAPDAAQAVAAPAAPAHAELTLEVKEPTREDIAAAKEAASAKAVVEPVDYFSSEVPPPRPSFVAAPAPLETAPQGFDPDRGFGASAPEARPETIADVAPPAAPAAPLRPPETAARLKLGLEQQKESDAARQALEAQSAAAAVFAAKARSHNRRPLVIAGIGLLLLAGAAAYGYVQFMRATQPSELSMVTPPPAVAPAPPLPAPEAGVAPAPAPAPVPVTAAADATPVATPVAAAPGPTRTRAPAAAPAKVRAAAAPMPAPAAAARDGAAIAVVRNDGSRQLNPTLKNAYQAFVAGDMAAARSQYQRVLQQEPDNRDALLGMAAIAVNRGQASEAGSFYTRLLELDPTDAEAASGLAGVQGGDPTQSESNLKKVLATSPQTGSAHFALGNVYAQQQRWPEAQQAYFQAVGAAPANADYAFNLAVSLDKLGHKKLALESYQRALQLAQAGAANVNQVTVQQRIGQLRQDLNALPK
jgi:tetratricopeptide (TPR) repeat protein